ncbi:MAG: M3 family metallopeptidase [Bacteroidota bacterium]
METSLSGNPLLHTEGLPQFSQINPEHVVPAVEHLIAEITRQFETIEKEVTPTWEGVVTALEALDVPFEYAWGPISHLLSVKNQDELRTAHQDVLPKVVALGLRISQSSAIYKGLVALRESEAWDTLNEGQQRAVSLKIRAAEHAGVGLEGKAKDRFAEIAKELSQLSTDFSNHVLDATKAFELLVTDPAHTAGWPQSLRQVAAHSHAMAQEGEATPNPENGPWRITLDYPSFVPFMQHSRQREQREQVYRAFITRASAGELDNAPLIDKILALRKEKAALLGYDTFADLSLAAKMAPGVDAVREMTASLTEKSRSHALREHEELETFAKQSGHESSLAHWDVAFWSERLREEKFAFTDEELRPYFPLDRVRDGLFKLCTSLFGVTFEEVNNEPSVWHDDVQFYRVLSEAGDHIASFYLDPFSRPAEKRGGAWMDSCLDRRWHNGALQVPVVHLCCNGTPPVGDVPSLMSFREVETLFHEFGHGLQGMLTTVDYASVAGINGVEWDAVELASQFMENWCYHKPTLLGMTAHYETGEPLPEALFEKICAARTYRAGSQMVRQLLFGALDIALHSTYTPDGNGNVWAVYRKLAGEILVKMPLPEDRFLCSFSHIFAGGYAAGYYSYKWAEVLSADAFAAFEEAGLDNTTAIESLGRKYRDTVLAQGGSRHPMDVYQDFRGRAPNTDALLRHAGLS